jgi:hypothetical protein
MVPIVGTVTDWHAIERVLELHAPELASEALEEVPAWLRRLGASVTLENETARLSRVIAIKSPSSAWDTVELRSFTLSELAERFPDAAIGL